MRFQNKEYHQTEIGIQHVDIDGQLRKDNDIYPVCTQLLSFLMHEAKADISERRNREISNHS